MSPARRIAILLATLVLGAVLILTAHSASDELRPHWFISGWAFALVYAIALGVESRRAWHGESGNAWWRFCGSLLILSGFLAHTETRIPQGGLELIMWALFLVALASLFFGGISSWVLRSVESAKEPQWRSVYFPAAYSLLVVGGIHAVLSHAHGFLAATFGMSP